MALFHPPSEEDKLSFRLFEDLRTTSKKPSPDWVPIRSKRSDKLVGWGHYTEYLWLRGSHIYHILLRVEKTVKKQ